MMAPEKANSSHREPFTTATSKSERADSTSEALIRQDPKRGSSTSRYARLPAIAVFLLAIYIIFIRFFGSHSHSASRSYSSYSYSSSHPFKSDSVHGINANTDIPSLVHQQETQRIKFKQHEGQQEYLAGEGKFLIGVGKADITGPVVELNLMGYAETKQIGSGVRQRLYSRAFIVGDIEKPHDRFVYLVLDTQAGDTAVRYGILSGLKELGPEYSMYGHDGLAVSGTHSHSGPGAWLNYLLPQITSLGFDHQSYRAIVDGCILSIRRAHESLEPGYLTVGSRKLFGANINRSLFAYLANPEAERAMYNVSSEDDGSVEKDLTMIKFQRASDGKNVGVLTWFPTHGTSMYANNTLITGDNKGVAADLFEKKVRGSESAAQNFVAGFSQANMGDATPNTLGAWCEDGSGEKCSFKSSTCKNGSPKLCHGRGPRFLDDDFGASSCLEIGRIQYQGAFELYSELNSQKPNVAATGVKAFHKFHDMTDYEFNLPNGTVAKTCAAALGYSFAGGTWDYPGQLGGVSQQGSNSSNARMFLKAVGWLIKPVNKKQSECHHPKQILLNVGERTSPYHWTPNIVDVQTFRVGQFFIIVSSGEATTMSGRRWKRSVAEGSKEILKKELGGQEPVVVLGGPSNSYTHYITTEEEYGVQRYEGGSTLYGRHTLSAYIHQTKELLYLLGNDAPEDRSLRETGPLPPDNSKLAYGFNPPVLYDSRPWGRQYGEVTKDITKIHFVPGETVNATFVGANPRNNLRLEQTYAAVEYKSPSDGTWRLVRDDSDWNLVFHWRRVSWIRGISEAEVSWSIEEGEEAPPAGEYRLKYFGDAKVLGGRITGFEGVSSVFYVG